MFPANRITQDKQMGASRDQPFRGFDTMAQVRFRNVMPGARSFGIALIFVATATAVFVFCRTWLDDNEASLFYLPVVIACAVRLGFGAAVFAAVVSFLCWDYFFLPPYHTLVVDSQRSWISMIVFAITAVTTASLASRVREQARVAQDREREMATLLKASQLVSLAVDSDETLLSLVREACRSYQSSLSAIFQLIPDAPTLHLISVFGDVDSLDHAGNRITEAALSSVVNNELHVVSEVADGAVRGIYAPISYRGNPIGAFFVRMPGEVESIAAINTRLIATLAGHAAVVIARRQATDETQTRIRQNAILDERRRIAQEVHDTLSNTFNSIKFLMEAAQRSGPGEPAQRCVDLALGLAVDGAQEARRSVWALRPVAFDYSGSLAEAICRLGDLSGNGEKTSVSIHVTGEPVSVSREVEDNFYRIAQEAVSNALRHARASTIELSLVYTSGFVELSVKDDGVGFATDQRRSGGFGIENMGTRAKSMAADLTIVSEFGAGTVISVKAPVG